MGGSNGGGGSSSSGGGFDNWWDTTGSGLPNAPAPDGLGPMSTPTGQPGTISGQPGPVQAGLAGNPYQGGALQNQVSGAFTSGLGQYQNLGDRSGGMMDLGMDASQGAGGAYQNMLGYNPQNVQGGQIANTDLSPYMNPYQQNVIDTTMDEMNQQQGMRQQGIDDSAQSQGAFGGDRMYVQKALSDKYHGQNQANVLSQMNASNFNNAQQQGQFDINSQMKGDLANQGMNASMLQGGAGGLGQLGQGYSTLGGQFGQTGAEGLSNMANTGFGFGQKLQQNEMAMGGMQQQLNQQMMDAIKNQFYGFANQGNTGLNVLTQGNQVGQTGSTTNTQNNPGALDYLGAGLGLFGMF